MTNANDVLLTVTQALQLVGLAPSLFIVFFLSSLIGRNRQTIVPICYFLALACSFGLALLEPYAFEPALFWPIIALRLGAGLLAAFSFLLICQFMLGRIPPRPYWLVLLIPLLGGIWFFYTSLTMGHDTCTLGQICPDIVSLKRLYNIMASAFIFLLLVYQFSRMTGLHSDELHKKHKYWLIVALILLYVLALALDLAELAGHITPEDALRSITILKLAFIYLVLTSLFRVFYPALASEAIHTVLPGTVYDPALDAPYAEKVRILLEQEHVYREMRINRAELARRIGIGEHQLSRVINRHFEKNFNELLNGYRIEEAKQRLKNEPNEQITVIAFEIGFNSIASFNRVFKEKVGVSPSQWREGGVNSPSGSAVPVVPPSE